MSSYLIYISENSTMPNIQCMSIRFSYITIYKMYFCLRNSNCTKIGQELLAILANIARQKKTFASNHLLLLNKTRIIRDIKFYLLLIKEKEANNEQYYNDNNT